jgi:hypothetical protein
MRNILEKATQVFAVLVSIAAMGLANTTRMPVPGTLNYVEGQVTVDGRQVSAKAPGSSVLGSNEFLDTEHGRAEMLLVPGVFLRVGDDSQVEMLSPDLTNTKIRLTKGSAMLEVDELFKQNNISVATANVSTRIDQKGLYDFNADQALVGVIQGKATAYEDDSQVNLTKGHELAFAGGQALKAQKLDEGTLEASSLYRWSELRSQYEAQANLNAAQTVVAYGGWFGPGWYWAPYWGFYSFIPPIGMLYSPFGWGFYSPGYVVAGRPLMLRRGAVGRAGGVRAAMPMGQMGHFGRG